LQQLGLYLNKDTNNQIFTVFEHILNHPKGLTYEVISKRLKADIITISHYCCKLKKMRLIDWEHEK
jgi:predicted transcriptional regulator